MSNNDPGSSNTFYENDISDLFASICESHLTINTIYESYTINILYNAYSEFGRC